MLKVSVPSLAKLNLDLRVLHKRPDGFHELRTVFQTISLSDKLTIEFEPARRTEIELASSVEIADNLVVRAARLVLDRLKTKARIRFTLEKRIPMGAGMGGGSSNAASVLIALPALAKRPLSLAESTAIGEALGSDVPFFLHGGTALGFGRGTELYPLPDARARHIVVVAPGVHVSTVEAYRLLDRETVGPLTSQAESPILREFQRVIWNLPGSPLEQNPFKNDFEGPVFRVHPELERVVRKLKKSGAKSALMTGSGSAIWGVFEEADRAQAAFRSFPQGTAFRVQFVGRKRYRSLWLGALGNAAAASCFESDL